VLFLRTYFQCYVKIHELDFLFQDGILSCTMNGHKSTVPLLLYVMGFFTVAVGMERSEYGVLMIIVHWQYWGKTCVEMWPLSCLLLLTSICSLQLMKMDVSRFYILHLLELGYIS
jgi:hypothetical protein